MVNDCDRKRPVYGADNGWFNGLSALGFPTHSNAGIGGISSGGFSDGRLLYETAGAKWNTDTPTKRF